MDVDVSSEDLEVFWTPGTLAGVVKVGGVAPRGWQLDMGVGTCAQAWGSEKPRNPARVVFKDGSVHGAVVYAKRGPHTGLVWELDPSYQPQMVIARCLFWPRVIGLMAGETIEIANNDRETHELAFNAAQNASPRLEIDAGKKQTVRFAKREREIPFRHVEHRFANGWVHVFDHPFFFVTDGNGQFDIPDLPPGEYTFVALHETFGEAELEVSITSSDVTTVEFLLPGKR